MTAQKKLTKCQRILMALKAGRRLTSMDGFMKYKTTRLGGLVFHLRRQGWNIKTMSGHARDGTRFAVYYMGRPYRR